MKYINKTFDLIILEILFFNFFLFISSNSFNYYFNNKFYEGFQVAVSNIVFTILTLPLLALLFFKKDFANFREVGYIVLIIFISVFLGFKIPFAILPFVIGYEIFRLGTQIKKRILKYRHEQDAHTNLKT
ncbi:hypothetical protein [uncultured Flavobacterium sp.]|uniref:hypothetical protein n=1 Tax=uncultured Flavobacterium sp. TaxID=165435 RepID=UPI0029312A2E|nr:hypothetical protein [uncultured Flavobacterium sp.]